MWHKSKLAFGIFAILVTLSSGCTTAPKTMAFNDLDYYQIDCRRKVEQIAYLQSLRRTADDRLIARLSNMVQPWKSITDPYEYSQRAVEGNNRYNWLINQKLLALSEC